jgi:hypothetical protein
MRRFHRPNKRHGAAQRRGTRAAQRPFPPPWTAEETDAYFIVRYVNRQALAYVYFEEEPGRRAAASCSNATRRGASPRTSPSCRRGLLQKPRASIDRTSAMTSTPDISPDCAH